MQKNCCDTDTVQKSEGKGFDVFLVGIIAATFLLLGGVILVGSQMGASADVSTDTQVETQVNATRHDWGTIGIDDGITTTTFIIENNGSSPLKLYDVKTSCMCTTAQLRTSETSSKQFGMHENTKSVFEFPSGERAELVVSFDPAYHGPSGIGPIERAVTMRTNDASQPTLSFQVSALVVK